MATAVDGHTVHQVFSEEYTEICQDKIFREDLDLSGIGFSDKIAYVLHNVLTHAECEALIQKTESVGYSPALVHAGSVAVFAPGYRDSQRLMIDDTEFASILFKRIGPHLPQQFQDNPEDNTEVYKLKEINERLRFLRYDIGDKFKAHYDSYYERPDGSAVTWVTLQAYLNHESLVGGETTFLRVGSEDEWSQEDFRVPVAPTAGSVLVFQHDILHEGSKVYGGRKYTIRMDVLYAVDEDANKALDD